MPSARPGRPAGTGCRRIGAALLVLGSLLPASPAFAAGNDAASPATTAAPADTPERQRLHALFERQDAWLLESFPEFGTYRGDHRRGALLADVSPAALAAVERDQRRFLAEAEAIDPARLGREDRISRDMFIEQLQGQLAMAAYPAARDMTLTALGGPQTDLAELVALMPVATAAQVEQLLARLGQAFPRRMDQEIAGLRRAAAAGWVPGRDVLRRVLQQIDAQLADDPAATPFYRPFQQLGRDIAPSERTALQARGREAIAQQVLPGLRRLRALVSDELLPRAPEDGALHRYPDGARVYALAIQRHTGRALGAQALHDIGRRELQRLHAEIAEVMREMRWPAGDFAGFVQHLNTDPRYFHSSPAALLDGYRAIAKRIDGELPKLFAELPRAPYAVLPMPAHMGADRAEYYQGPALDGSRGGAFYASTAAFRARPIWSMEALVAHEAVPGHHLQIALGQERRDLPPFRRGGFGRTAYVEGWALYAETLGGELGLYTEPASRFGALQMQALRAARLVVDTGLHALGWPRQQAIDFLRAQTGLGEGFVTSEVDRYLSVPGQALAYMVGRLTIEELRDRARQRLGARFDLRKFHQVVLGSGALPLATLERVVDDWLAAETGAAAPTSTTTTPAAGAPASASAAGTAYPVADLQQAERLRDAGLQDTRAWDLVAALTSEVGPRPAGSAGDARAVDWALQRLRALGFANVRAEPVTLQAWKRGAAHAHLTAPYPQPLVMTALGNSVATPAGGLQAEIAYYRDFAALRADQSERARGRIVFIDEPTARTRDGAGYGRAVAARVNGAIEAARRGAVAVAIRSIGTDRDRLAHTGTLRYDPAVPRIPALAVSVPDADLIARLAAHPAAAQRPLAMHLVLQAEDAGPAQSANVIAEVPGTDLAHEVVALGAHLDSWDLGTGAIDDGAGVAIVTAAAKLILDGGQRPRRTVRVVLFANEENGFDGARAYGERYREQPHQLIAESDFGAGRVWRLRSRVRAEALPQLADLARVLAPLGIAAGGNDGVPGPDAALLMQRQRWPGLELSQDGSDYFDWHHTANDTLDKIDPRTLPQNVAAWAAAAWLAAQSPQAFGPLPAPSAAR